jgi:hypothetical protein
MPTRLATAHSSFVHLACAMQHSLGHVYAENAFANPVGFLIVVGVLYGLYSYGRSHAGSLRNILIIAVPLYIEYLFAARHGVVGAFILPGLFLIGATCFLVLVMIYERLLALKLVKPPAADVPLTGVTASSILAADPRFREYIARVHPEAYKVITGQVSQSPSAGPSTYGSANESEGATIALHLASRSVSSPAAPLDPPC